MVNSISLWTWFIKTFTLSADTFTTVPLSQPSAVKHSTMSFSLIVLLGVVIFFNLVVKTGTAPVAWYLAYRVSLMILCQTLPTYYFYTTWLCPKLHLMRPLRIGLVIHHNLCLGLFVYVEIRPQKSELFLREASWYFLKCFKIYILLYSKELFHYESF